MRVLLILAALVLVTSALGPAGVVAAPNAGSAVGHRVARSPGEIRRFWDGEALANAVPVEQLDRPNGPLSFTPPDTSSASRATRDFVPGNVTAYPQRVHGKIFFEEPGNPGLFSCSGTLVSSKLQNIVITAGHCVFNPTTGQYSANVVFDPGYEAGTARLGSYPAAGLFTLNGWKDQSSFSYDIGVIVLGQPLGNTLGTRGVAFNLSTKNRHFTIFGYPAKPNPPFDGKTLIGCDSDFVGAENTGDPPSIVAAPCSMQQGASGGGWVTAGGYVNSVVSHGYCNTVPDLCGYIHGPYFGDAATNLYKAAGGSVRPVARIKSGPRGRTRNRRPLFRFGGTASTPISKYLCKLGGGRFRRCFAATKISRLGRGPHTLRIKIVDQTGKKSKTVKRRFRIVR